MKSRKVTVLDNEYYQKQMAIKQRDERQRKKVHKYRLFKRACAGILVLCAAFSSLVIGRGIADKNRLEAQKEVAQEALKNAQHTNSSLNFKIEQLNDEDYVQKLIRKKYLYSKNNEIIFSLPEDNSQTDQNN